MSNKNSSKQVIIIRKDLKMRRGKEIAQGSHASMAFLTRRIYKETEGNLTLSFMEREKECIEHWLEHSFRKIVLTVNSEVELKEIHEKALDKGLLSHLVTDNGATEFNGVPTVTCACIGPCWDEDFIGLTDKLPLY